MIAGKRSKPTSGPVRILSDAEIARDYPTEASAAQLDALRDRIEATQSALDRNRDALPSMLFDAIALDLIADRVALVAGGFNHGA